ncbi:MAG TPA: hypothetical protein DGT23_14045 [Micromonosporaceae bacterium]|nr:hypothetical protein [Micromonosporaceae bacterium]
MRRLIAPIALSTLFLAAACSTAAPTVSNPTPTSSSTAPAATKSATPAPVPTGSPCEISKAALDKVKPVQDKYAAAYGSNDAAKAEAAKADIQAQLRAIAGDMRAAAAASTANEVDLKEALLTTAAKIEAGAADPALFKVAKTPADATMAFTTAAAGWIPMTLLASCAGK